jgi:hypothetical protein
LLHEVVTQCPERLWQTPETKFYNIRHLQHHVGELAERLGTQAGIDIAWVGTTTQQAEQL